MSKPSAPPPPGTLSLAIPIGAVLGFFVGAITGNVVGCVVVGAAIGAFAATAGYMALSNQEGSLPWTQVVLLLVLGGAVTWTLIAAFSQTGKLIPAIVAAILYAPTVVWFLMRRAAAPGRPLPPAQAPAPSPETPLPEAPLREAPLPDAAPLQQTAARLEAEAGLETTPPPSPAPAASAAPAVPSGPAGSAAPPRAPRTAAHPAAGPAIQVLDVTALAITAALLALVLLDVSGPPRAVLALFFTILVPGWAVVANWPAMARRAKIAPAVALSLAVTAGAATIALWAHWWNPVGLFYLEAAAAMAGIVAGAFRRRASVRLEGGAGGR